MNVRTLVVLLLLANLLFWAWTQGVLDALGLPPARPAAVAAPADVRAEALRLLPVQDLVAAAAAAAPDPETSSEAVDTGALPLPATTPAAEPAQPGALPEATSSAVDGPPARRVVAGDDEQEQEQRGTGALLGDAAALQCWQAGPVNARQAPLWMAYGGSSGEPQAGQAWRGRPSVAGIDPAGASDGFQPGWSLRRLSSNDMARRASHVLQGQTSVFGGEQAARPPYVPRAEGASGGERQPLQDLLLAGQAPGACP